MNYDNPELASRLASEYVLGTLRGPALVRFQRLLLTSPVLRAEVLRWEQRLGSWGTLIGDDAQLPEAVWERIRSRIGTEPAVTPVAMPRSSWRWPAALAAGLLAFVLAGRLLPVQRTAPQQTPSTPVAVLKTSEGEPRWVISVTRDQLLLASIKGTPAFPADRSPELWALPRQGTRPQSLGVISLHDGQASIQLDARRRQLMANAAALAISLEPPGGSRTGSPTGPVVLTSPLSPTAFKAAEQT